MCMRAHAHMGHIHTQGTWALPDAASRNVAKRMSPDRDKVADRDRVADLYSTPVPVTS